MEGLQTFNQLTVDSLPDVIDPLVLKSVWKEILQQSALGACGKLDDAFD